MKLSFALSRPSPRRRGVWPPFALALLAAGLCAAPWAHGQSIAVPNFSFENPTTTFVTPNINNWQKLPQPADFDTSQGYTWDQIAGVFLNTPVSSTSDHITNIDGNQASYVFNAQGMGLYQTLSTTFQLGQAYHLTAAFVGQGGGMVDGSIIQLQIYYLDTNSNIQVIASTTATENATNFPNHTTEYDYSVDVPKVGLFDLWLGRPIGIEIVSPDMPAFIGGYWDVDNVRLLATPEPGSVALLVLGGLALLRRRTRWAA